MGKSICADNYVGDREAQYWFRLYCGGSGEYPWEIRQRLDRKKRRRNSAKKITPVTPGRKDNLS